MQKKNKYVQYKDPKKSIEVSVVASGKEKHRRLKPMIAKANMPWRRRESSRDGRKIGELTNQNSPVGGREGGGYLGEIVSVCTRLAGCEVCGNLS